MDPSVREDDINQPRWWVNIKPLSGQSGGGIFFFFPSLFNGAVNNQGKQSHGGWRLCGPRQRGSIITIENITANDRHPGHQRWSSHKFHALHNRPVTFEGWRENNAQGWSFFFSFLFSYLLHFFWWLLLKRPQLVKLIDSMDGKTRGVFASLWWPLSESICPFQSRMSYH